MELHARNLHPAVFVHSIINGQQTGFWINTETNMTFIGGMSDAEEWPQTKYKILNSRFLDLVYCHQDQQRTDQFHHRSDFFKLGLLTGFGLHDIHLHTKNPLRCANINGNELGFSGSVWHQCFLSTFKEDATKASF